MGNLQLHKINACRFDYEYMGKSIGQLATTYGFRTQDLELEIQLNGWERKLDPVVMPETTDIKQFAESLDSITRSRLNIISLFRQIDQQPMIAEIEKTLLEKCAQLAAAISPDDEKATTKLTNLVKAVSALQDRNPIDLADSLDKKLKNGAGSGLTVNILNQVN